MPRPLEFDVTSLSTSTGTAAAERREFERDQPTNIICRSGSLPDFLVQDYSGINVTFFIVKVTRSHILTVILCFRIIQYSDCDRTRPVLVTVTWSQPRAWRRVTGVGPSLLRCKMTGGRRSWPAASACEPHDLRHCLRRQPGGRL